MTLEEKINYYADNYYAGNALISDEEFDALCEAAKIPSGLNGNDLKGITKMYDLPVTMGTLEKLMTIDEFRNWFIHNCGNSLMAETKIDGCGALLEYTDGELTFAYSRGDSEKGADLTSNILKVINVQHTIKTKSSKIYIRGEVVMKRSIFNEFFKGKGKNPRNMCAGIIKRLDGSDCDKLNFIAYDVFNFDPDCEEYIDDTEVHKLNFLQENGFETPEFKLNPTIDELIEWRNTLDTEGEIPCDGIVIKQNIVDVDDLMRKTPMKNVAFKPEMTVKVTTLNKIIWELAGSQLSPVAEVEPVELCGTTVSRASLSNVNIMNDMGAYEGAQVCITKRGEIIPKIMDVIDPKKNAFEVPKICPVCGGEVVVNESGFPMCMNKNCKRKLGHRFGKMFDLLDIKGCGDVFIKNIEDECVSVKDFLDFVLEDSPIINKWAGGINGRKIVAQMKLAMETPMTLAKFLATFDYKGFDEKKLDLLCKYDIDQLLVIKEDELMQIDGFGEITSSGFVDFMIDCAAEIQELLPYFKIKKAEDVMGSLTGLSFCFTGSACRPRKELEELVAKNGGTSKSGVTSKLSYLVTDDTESGSTKNKKAKEFGIPVITSVEFLKMVGEENV